ncbi:MAG: endo alpha-1,4 polygalactosaminidase [Flavobacterium sp.]
MWIFKNVIFFSILIQNIPAGCNSSDKKTKEAGRKMQEFVISISQYAKNQKNDFIIIPQNGVELAFSDVNPSLKFHDEFLNAIDGFGIEELFYDHEYKPDDYRINILKKLSDKKLVFVSEVVQDSLKVHDAISQNLDMGFIPFIRSKENYHYGLIPEFLTHENSKDIMHIHDVKNYLYLINNSKFDTKEEYLQALRNYNADLLIIDLYYLSFQLTAQDVQSLKTKSNGSKRKVIAYMNIGAAENWRYYWNSDWKLNKPGWLKKKYSGYDNEIWVEFWHPAWQKIIFQGKDSYLQKIIDTDFDGVYLDNVEAYYTLYN